MSPSNKLRSASQALATAVATSSKITAAIARTGAAVGDVDQLRAEVARAQAAYETVAADAELGGASEQEVQVAEKARETAQARLDAAMQSSTQQQAIRAGLERKLAVADAEVLEAEKAVGQAEVEYLTEEIEVADRQFVELSEQVAAVARRVHACAIEIRLRQAKLPRDVAVEYAATLRNGLRAIGPASANAVRAANKGRNEGFHTSPVVDDMEPIRQIKAELASIAQDQGLIGRVRQLIAGAQS